MIIIRYNPMDLKYCLSPVPEDKNQTNIVLVNRKITMDPIKSIVVDMPLEEVNTCWFNWRSGQLIQDAFPTFSGGEREFLITGITPDEWDKLFPPKKEDARGIENE